MLKLQDKDERAFQDFCGGETNPETENKLQKSCCVLVKFPLSNNRKTVKAEIMPQRLRSHGVSAQLLQSGHMATDSNQPLSVLTQELFGNL